MVDAARYAGEVEEGGAIPVIARKDTKDCETGNHAVKFILVS